MTAAAGNPHAGKLIVAVDDVQDNLSLLQRWLEGAGYRNLRPYLDPLRAREALGASEAPDLFLLDVMMPELDGISLCREIKGDKRFAESSVVFLTARHEDEMLHQAFAAGAQDFLRKPYSRVELLCRLNSIFALQDLTRKLAQASITDGLTGLFNRGYLDARLEEELYKCDRYGHRLSFMLMDLDRFKQINDTAGHPVGDEALRRVAALIRGQVRTSDVVARYGGDEIALMASGTGLDNAVETAERIRQSAERLRIPGLDRAPTLSMGLAEYDRSINSITDLVRRADLALYKAKEDGRNAVRSYPRDTGPETEKGA